MLTSTFLKLKFKTIQFMGFFIQGCVKTSETIAQRSLSQEVVKLHTFHVFEVRHSILPNFSASSLQ